MITLILLLLIAGGLLFVVSMGCIVLLDPIICVIAVYVIYKVIKRLVKKKK